MDPGFLYNIGENWIGDRSLASSMASVWQFASTRGFMFLVNAQRADPAALQVLDTMLQHNQSLELPVPFMLLAIPEVVRK